MYEGISFNRLFRLIRAHAVNFNKTARKAISQTPQLHYLRQAL